MKIQKQVENKEQYLSNCDKNLEALKNYHCAIYAPDKEGNPISIGSGVLIEVYGQRFLVSAGHVFDYRHTHKLCLNSKNRLIGISGYIIETKFSPTRKEDKIDVAILELDDKMREALSDYNYLNIDNIEYNHISDDDHIIYTFVGFPATKNKTRYNSKSVRSTIFSYSANRVNDDIYKELNISSITHIAIKFRKKKLVSTDDKMMNAPDPYAMSGGGIWLNDNFHHHPSVYTPKTKLVGIALSWHMKYQCLMGVSSGAIIELLKAHCDIPELKQHRTNILIT